MKKTILYFLIGIMAFATPTPSKSQEPNPTTILSEAIARVELINSLSGAHPKVKSHKTTSSNRAITAKVHRSTFGVSSRVSVDSVVYVNQPGRYSELQSMDFNYYLTYTRKNINLKPSGTTNFAANTIVHYFDSYDTGVYIKIDTSSITYNAGGDISATYDRDFRDNYYVAAFHTYDSRYRLHKSKYEVRTNTGGLINGQECKYLYGINYVILDYGYVRDSATVDANGRVLTYYRTGRTEEFSYDANGYLATYKLYIVGQLYEEFILTYEPDYKQYAYAFKLYRNGIFYNVRNRILVGNAGRLDSVYFAWYDTTGAFLANTDFTKVTTDSFGNITFTETRDDQGRFLESYRYYYEDVVTGLSDIRTPFSDFKVYPNPGTQDDIMISTGENFSSVNISSMSGQKVLHTSFRPRHEMRLDVSNLSAGSYLISIRSDDGRESSQVFTKM